MDNFYARSVFFVTDGEEALAFYTQKWGFTLGWNYQYEGRAFVFQVNLFGFELILNQTHSPTRNREGHGRAFMGLEPEQAAQLVRHIQELGIKPLRVEWGAPTLALRDPDGNELFFWIPESEWANLPPDLPQLYPEAEAG